MTLKIAMAGATGWTGAEITRGVLAAPDMTLVAAVARKAAGQDIGEALGGEPAGVVIVPTVAEALDGSSDFRPDVLIDYTQPASVKDHALQAIERGIAVVVGTSGLTPEDYGEIEAAAKKKGVGVVGGGNFSLTGALQLRFAKMAAKYMPQYEIMDMMWGEKEDVPSGTARDLAEGMAAVQKPEFGHDPGGVIGPKDARGTDIEGVRVHSLRMDGYKVRLEVHLGLPGERLSLIQEAGTSAVPYVSGTLMAARRAVEVTGLERGLDSLLFGS